MPKLTKWQLKMWNRQNGNLMVNQILIYLEAKLVDHRLVRI